MHFPFFKSDSKVDVLNQPFNENNAAHVEHIMQKLSNFTQAKDKLFSIDNKLMLGVGADLFLLTIGIFGPWTVAIGLVALGYASVNKLNRPEASNDFKMKLNELMDVYHWMLKNKTSDVTNIDLVMNVMQTIAPFVETKEILPWKVFSALPERYKTLLEQPPHRIRFVTGDNPNTLSALVKAAFNYKAIDSQSVDEEVSLQAQIKGNAKAAAGMFAQTLAEAERGLYGYQGPTQGVVSLRNG